MVGLIEDHQSITGDKFFKVFEFTKGKVYFELIDESNLDLYAIPVLVRDAEKNMVHDNPNSAIEQLKGYLPQVEGIKEKEKIKISLDEEIKRLSEKYNIS